MAYTIYEKKRAMLLLPAVTITAAGRISLNAALTRIFHQNAFKKVLLLVDAEKKRIILRPATGISPLKITHTRAYRICYSSYSCQALVCSESLLRTLGWVAGRYRVATRWDPKSLLMEFDIPQWEKRAYANVVVMETRPGVDQRRA